MSTRQNSRAECFARNALHGSTLPIRFGGEGNLRADYTLSRIKHGARIHIYVSGTRIKITFNMSTAFTSKIAKAGFGLVAGIAMFAGVSALALTSADVQMLLNAGIINSTQAAALMASTTSTTTTSTGLGSCYQFTTQLSVGSTGEAVRQLQMVLNSNPATALAVAAGANGSAGHESTYFGAATSAAVMKYQAWKGIAQVGQVGPQTRAALNASCTTSTTTTTTTTGGNTGTTTTGAVSVGLSTDNPSANTIVTGQATADLAHFTFTGSGTVTSLVLQRTGISTNSTLQAVYLYQGATRLTDSASVNTNGVITFNGLNLAVNGSATVAVKADIIPDSGTNGSTTASGQTVGVTLTGYTVNGTAMTANVSGNIQSVTSGYGVLATVNLAQGLAATVTNSTQSYNNTTFASVNAGTTGYSVFSLPVQVGTRSVLLKGLTLRYIGSAANGSLANIKLFVDGVQAGTAATVNSNGYIVFDLSGAPYTLTTGGHTVEVRADITGGSARTFYVSLQNAADFMVTDSQLNVNVAPSTSGSTFSISQAGTISVNAGSATFQQDPAFTSTTNITGGASNAVIGQFSLTGYGEDVKVMSLPVTVFIANATPTAAGINNVALYFNGAQVGSSISLTGAGTGCTVNGLAGACYTNSFQLGSQLIIPAGSSDTLQVRADLQNSSNISYSAGSIAAQIGTGTGQGVMSLQAVTIPGATVTGNTLTIQTGQLVVSKNAGYTNQTFSPNTTGVKIGSFTIQNQSSSEAVRVTNLQVGLTSDSAGMTALTSGSTPALTNFSNLKIVDESGLITGLNPVGSVSGTNNFSTSYTVAAGQSQTVDVYADIGGASTGTAYTTLTVQAIGASSNVTLTPALTVGQAVMLGTGSVSAPSIVSSATTSSQYVATASNATNATKVENQFTATNGTGMISELKYAVVGSVPGTVSTITVGSSTASVVTPATTTLTVGSTSATTVTVGSSASIPVGTVVTASGEQMLVTAVPSSTTLTVVRAINGTVASTDSAATATPSGLAYITNLNISVPNGTSGAYVDAYQTYSPVNGTTGSLASGSTSQVLLTYVKSTIGSTTTSGAVTPTAGNQVTLVGSEPTLTVNSVQQTGLNVGATAQQIGQVTIAANTAGTIGVNQIKFNIGNSGFSSGFNLASAIISDSGSAVMATGASCPTVTSSTVICTFSGTNGYLIPAGSSKTFSLYATVTGTTAASSTVSVSSQVDSAGFNWTDVAGGGASGALHGALIYGFPTNSYSIRQ